jgi:NAD(P)-dependent dehydrogenase (short-subunit alcohol dehydrogenase family)
MKAAVITGGTKGIGLALVRTFLLQGFQVFTCGSSPASVSKLRETLASPRLDAQPVDVADPRQIKDWADKILSKKPELAALINNAGRFVPGSITSEEEGAFELMISTNLASAYYSTRAFLPAFLNQKSGHIFNICSTASITAYTNGGSYCISKFGLLGLGKVLREELKDKGIKVTSVLPGATLTDSWAGTDLPESRFMKPEDVADIIWATFQLSPSAVVEEILLRPFLGDIG